MALTKIDDRGLKTPIDLIDNEKIRLGTGNDLELWHQTGNSYITSTGANLTLRALDHIYLQDIDGNTMADFNDGGAVELYHNNSKKLNTESWGVDVTGTLRADDISLQDSHILKIGTDNDLQLTHSGADSTISKTTAGNLLIYVEEDFYLKHGTEKMIAALDDGAVELYYDNSKKFETASHGITTLGDVFFDNQVNAGKDVYWDESADRLSFSDNTHATFGNGEDLRIYHDGTDNIILSNGASCDLLTYVANGELAVKAVANGAVELYYDNVKTLETADNGNVNITGAADLRLTLGSQGTAGTNDANWIRADTTNLMYNSASGHHTWEVGGNTEARLTSGGYFKALGTATSFLSAGGSYHEFQQTNESNVTAYFKSETASSSYGIIVRTSTNDAGQYAIRVIGNDTDQFFVQNDGDCENTNNRYQAISDIKLKENVVDANSQWNDIKAIKVRNYNYKSSTGYKTHKQIGVIAQELETVCPNLVSERPDLDDQNNDLGTTTKTVAYSVLYMKAIKALQEAITKIETLETKVAALEAA